MKDKRQQRIKHFETFYDNCETIFTDLRDKDKRVIDFQNEYMLCICPGSRAGGNEKRIVEIFWGARPYEFETKGKNWKSLTETGATLFLYRNDTGHITISIYPAKTEFKQPIENRITLYEWLDPNKLKKESFIKSLWNDFIAYMECTSLDGNPTLYQRLRISYLRYFRHLVIDKKWQPTKFSIFYKDVFKWVLTVGLSGIIIYILTIITQPDTSQSDIELKKVNSNLENISIQLDSIIDKLKFKSIIIDSIKTTIK